MKDISIEGPVRFSRRSMYRSASRLFCTILLILLAAFVYAHAAAAQPVQDSDGTYVIKTADDLKWFRDAVNNGDQTAGARLAADIDLGGETWEPIGGSSLYYAGTFDGGGYTIKDFEISNADEGLGYIGLLYAGLFGYVKGGTIKNLTVSDALLTLTAGRGESSTIHAGVIAGYLDESSVVKDCTATDDCYVTIYAIDIDDSGTGNDCRAGGIAGSLYSAEIRNCLSSAEIQIIDNFQKRTYSSANAGGIVGRTRYGSVVNCAAVNTSRGVSISGSGTCLAGGIAGYGEGTTFVKCAASKRVQATDAGSEACAGGIAGQSAVCKIEDCAYYGSSINAKKINGQDNESAGGIVGRAVQAAGSSGGNTSIRYCAYSASLGLDYIYLANSSAIAVQYVSKRDSFDNIVLVALPKAKRLTIHPWASTELKFDTYPGKFADDSHATSQLKLSIGQGANFTLDTSSWPYTISGTAEEGDCAAEFNYEFYPTDVSNPPAVITTESYGSHLTTGSFSLGVANEFVPIQSASLSVSPEGPIYTSEEFTVTVELTPENASYQEASWNISPRNASLVEQGVDDDGKLFAVYKAHFTGTPEITADVGDLYGNHASASTTVNIDPTNVESVTLSRSELHIDMNYSTEAAISATVNPTNGYYSVVQWKSSDPAVAEVAPNHDWDRQASATITAKGRGQAIITASAGGRQAVCTVTVTPVYTTAVELSETELKLTAGETAKLAAVVTPDDATDKSVTWTSMNTRVATVDENGTVTAHRAGTAVISAAANGSEAAGAVQSLCTVTVTPSLTPVRGVTVTPDTLYLRAGEYATLSGSVTPDDATFKGVQWSSSDGTVATVSSSGFVYAIRKGKTTITATTNDGGYTDTCAVTVDSAPVNSVSISNELCIDDTVYVGESLTLTASVSPQNADQAVTWQVDATEGAVTYSVNQDGSLTLTAIGEGEVSVTAVSAGTDDSGAHVKTNEKFQTAHADVESVKIGADNLTIDMNNASSGTLTASITPENAQYGRVTWSVTPSIVEITPGNDEWASVTVTPTAGGAAVITAQAGEISDKCTLTVIPKYVTKVTPVGSTEISLTAGTATTLYATVSPADATDTTLAWSSSKQSVATVDAEGNVTAHNVGSATITAAANGSEQSGAVKAEWTVNVTSASVRATGVEVTPQELVLCAGDSASLAAEVTPEDATFKGVRWSSSNEAAASVSSTGVVTALAKGSATITAKTNDGGYRSSCKVTVEGAPVSSVTISDTSAGDGMLYVGESYTMKATVSPQNADQAVTWQVDDPNGAVAYSVNDDGGLNLSAVGEGAITVAAASAGTGENGGSIKASENFQVVYATASSLAIDKTSVTIDLHTAKSDVLEVSVEPGNAKYGKVVWSIEPSIADITPKNDQQTQVIITPTAGGEAVITAQIGELYDTCSLTVIPVYVENVTPVGETDLTLKSGSGTKLAVEITPAEATDRTLTWSSSNENVASVDADGNVTAHNAGEAVITAAANGSEGGAVKTQWSVTVTSPAVRVEGVEVTPASLEIEEGESWALSAEITPENATFKGVRWSSSNEAVAAVSADGIVTAAKPGSATVTATTNDGLKTSSCTVTVIGDTPDVPSGGGGGGCSAGFGALALLAAAPLCALAWKRGSRR